VSSRRHRNEGGEDEGSHDFGSLRFTWMLPIKSLIELVENRFGWRLFVPNVNCDPGAFVFGSGG
jgi:hypothetical protein